MAKAVGYSCDVCNKFETSEEGTKPEGWLRLTIHHPSRNGADDGFDICTNKCLVKLAKTRQSNNSVLEDSPQKKAKMASAKEALDGSGKLYHKMIHTRDHTNKNHVDDNCPFCLEALEENSND